MALADTISAQLTAIQSGEQAVLTAALTQAFQDGEASVAAGGITSAQEQADIAAAVQAATDPLNAQITAMGLDKQKEDALLAGVKNQVAALLASLG